MRYVAPSELTLTQELYAHPERVRLSGQQFFLADTDCSQIRDKQTRHCSQHSDQEDNQMVIPWYFQTNYLER